MQRLLFLMVLLAIIKNENNNKIKNYWRNNYYYKNTQKGTGNIKRYKYNNMESKLEQQKEKRTIEISNKTYNESRNIFIKKTNSNEDIKVISGEETGKIEEQKQKEIIKNDNENKDINNVEKGRKTYSEKNNELKNKIEGDEKKEDIKSEGLEDKIKQSKEKLIRIGNKFSYNVHVTYSRDKQWTYIKYVEKSNNKVLDNKKNEMEIKEDIRTIKDILCVIKTKEDKNNIGQMLRNEYMGVRLSVLVAGLGVVNGEIVFNMESTVGLKTEEDSIIFVNEDEILGFV